MSAQGLPAHILALFTCRPPAENLRPTKKRKMPITTGFADFIGAFEDTVPPQRAQYMTPKERRVQKAQLKTQQHKELLQSRIEEYTLF